MRVVAMDPAPAKESTEYTGGQCFQSIRACEMEGVIGSLDPPVLLCWDAPLTGPKDPANAGKTKGDFSQRRIESFFMRKETSFKTPRGISVRPYSGCPHWTITRSVLGLPRIGRHDKDYSALPFVLVPDEDHGSDGPAVSKSRGKFVVEIHPAVAAWLWCKDGLFRSDEDWSYKGGNKQERNLRQQMWEHIRNKIGDEELPCPKNDDQFDTLAGYVLGTRWLRGEADVVLLGDRETGAMLLPRVKDLEANWRKFQVGWGKMG